MQAKSTLAALYIIWRLIQDPKSRNLIVSGGGTQADDIAGLIVRIIMSWDILCWMRPDVKLGDRVSAKNFDVHRVLKGIDKSASVVSTGITSNLQGKRADFVLLDDVETQKNSATQPMRDTLLLYTKEFAAICIKGDIMYLGTPQTKDSVYKALPKRGYRVRVWTGRYPTNEELERYGAGVEIAPVIMEALQSDPSLQTGGGLDGKRGQPTDPNHISENTLQEKELEYLDEGFALQYMLDTTLSDANRTKIKLNDLIVLGVSSDQVPETVAWTNDSSKLVKDLPRTISDYRLYYGVGLSEKYINFKHKIMTLDPAGTGTTSGNDEMAYAVGGATESYIYILGMGGVRGGCSEENIHRILFRMFEDDIKVLRLERNLGAGAVTALFLSEIQKLTLKCDVSSQETEFLELLDRYGYTHKNLATALRGLSISDYTNTGQKERRIIDTIAPVTRRHRLVITEKAIAEDYECCLAYGEDKRLISSGLYQLSNITYDRGSLIHDDRADVCADLVRELQGFLAYDDEKASVVRAENDFQEWLRNPLGIPEMSISRGRKRNPIGRVTRRVGRR